MLWKMLWAHVTFDAIQFQLGVMHQFS
jgi:hypothetical protein